MPKKVYVRVVTRLEVEVDNNVSMDEVLQEMDYQFTSQTSNAQVVDTEMVDYQIVQ